MNTIEELKNNEYSCVLWDRLKSKPICLKDKFINEDDNNYNFKSNTFSKKRYVIQLMFI